jgi:hypothetical protein
MLPNAVRRRRSRDARRRAVPRPTTSRRPGLLPH